MSVGRAKRPIAAVVLGIAGLIFLTAFPGNESASFLGLLLFAAAVLAAVMPRRSAAAAQPDRAEGITGRRVGWAGLIMLGLSLLEAFVDKPLFGGGFGGTPNPAGQTAFLLFSLAPFVSLVAVFMRGGRSLGIIGLVLFVPTLFVILILAL